ncbi:hypothetical protein HWV62_39001 [Athelia sp. TMB]|nr:hypothetical protein HWV62_39001 [Athelia sp. TMB]
MPGADGQPVFSLKRSVRTARARKQTPKHTHKTTGEPLPAIPEGDEDDFFCRSASSSTSSLVFPTQPRLPAASHAPQPHPHHPRARTSSNTTIVDVARLSAYEFELDDALLAPRPAPSPPRTPSPVKARPRPASAASGFRMVLGPAGLEFPRAAPAPPSPSTTSSSADTLPVTPTDDEFAFQLHALASTRPLRIRKRECRARSPVSTTPELSSAGESDSEDDDAGMEWYAAELAGHVAAPLPSPAHACGGMVPDSPSPFPRFQTRPDSVVSVHPAFHPAPHVRGRPLPAIPATLMPSAALDPSFPRRKRAVCPPPPAQLVSKRASIPARAPPPPPSSVLPRPPPRSSVPADCAFDEDEDLLEIMDVDFRLALPTPGDRPRSVSASTASTQQSDAELDAYLGLGLSSHYAVFPPTPTEGEGFVTLDTDCDAPLRLPLSLPSTPLPHPDSLFSSPEEREREVKRVPSSESAFSFPPSPPSPPHALPLTSSSPEHALRSRWSSSTLASLPPPPAKDTHTPREKLRGYFAGLKASPAAPAAPLPYAGERGVRRSRSRSSVSTSGSADSGGSGGLRRKPIPLALLGVGAY